MTSTLILKKGEDRRIRAGHPWIFSNEVNTTLCPLKSFTPGQEVLVLAHDQSPLGMAYINPHSLIVARLYSREPERHLDVSFFKEKLTRALELRSRLYSKPFYRLVFSETDQLPGLIIDRFNHDFVLQINTAGMEKVKEIIATSLKEVFPDARSILFRNDSSIREQEGLPSYVESAFGKAPEIITLEENGVKFKAPFTKGQKTGWFYDHRDNRSGLKRYVKDKTVLDVFSYLGAFGIQAAAFGAKQVDCIEASLQASEFILENAALNQCKDTVNVITADAFDAMKDLAKSGKSYDVIILDPPAFIKKSKDKHEGLVAYQRINELALKLLKANGILVSCSCSMHLSMEDLTNALYRATYKTQSNVQILERGHQAPDHPVHIAIPETDYLKAIFARKL